VLARQPDLDGGAAQLWSPGRFSAAGPAIKAWTAAELAMWSCDGVARLSADAQALVLQSTTNDPVCVAPAVGLPATR
jgi:hypothetical protein